MPREIGVSRPEQKEQLMRSYVIDCRRHAEKEENMPGINQLLSERGKKQAKAVTTLTPPYVTGDCYVSKIARTGQTAEGMKAGQWQKAAEVLQVKEGKLIETDRLGAERFWISPEFRKEYFKIKAEKGLAVAAQWYLDFKDEKPFGADISPEEAAASYSSVILDLAEKLQAGEDDNKSRVVPKTIVSHDFMMESFLYYAIGDQIENDRFLPEGSFIDKIGGPTEYIGGFTIRLDQAGDKTRAIITLNGKDYAIDLDKLSALIDKYKAGWENESIDKQ